MGKRPLTATDVGRLGARALNDSMTAEERSERARNAALARHGRLTAEQRSEEARKRWRKRRRNHK